MSTTFDFTKSQFIENWDTKSEILEIKNNGVQVKRTATGESDVLFGGTVTGESGTTVNGGTKLVDWDNATPTIVTSASAPQQVKIQLSKSKFFKKFQLKLLKENEDETFGEITLEVSADGTNWIKVPFTQVAADDQITIYSQYPSGIEGQYVRITTNGTSTDATRIVFVEVLAYDAQYHIPFQIVKNTEALFADTLSAVSGTVTESGQAFARIQLLKSGTPYYWNGGKWLTAGADITRYDEFCCTIADANTNAASFIAHESDDLKIEVQIILITAVDITPAVNDIVLTE